MTEPVQENRSADFLLAEFTALQQRAAECEQLKTSRVNFFLIVVAASIAVAPTIIDKFQTVATQAILLIAVLLLLMGVMSLTQLVDYSVSGVIFQQRAGRIRRWFVDQDPTITPHVAFAPRDDRPSLVLGGLNLGLRGADPILFTINSFAATAAIVALVVQVVGLSSALVPSIIVGGAAFALVWAIQYWWVRRRIATARGSLERRGEIHFKYDDDMERLYRSAADQHGGSDH